MERCSASELIASEDALARKWIGREEGITSAFNYDEIAQQLLYDLLIISEVTRFQDDLRDVGAFDAESEFARRLNEIDELVSHEPAQADPAKLLTSKSWKTLQRTAREIVDLPGLQIFRNLTSQDFE